MSSVADFFLEVGLSFVPIFVAMDAIGILPFLLSFTQDMSDSERTRTVRLALITGLGLGLGFIAIGKGVFIALSIEVEDFLVAGGAILFVLAIRHLISGRMVEVQAAIGESMIGVVPLGTPLIVGPAVLTTLLVLIDQYTQFSVFPVLISFVLNLAIAWVIFAQSNRIARFLGQGGLRAISQVASLLLAAIAVMMIRLGVVGIMNM